MKTLLRILGGLAVLVLALVVAAFFFPQTYRVQRSVVVKAAPEKVFAQFGDLKAWKNWTAWHERDPQMKLSYSPETTGPGAWSAWESKTEGNGKMTFMTVEPQKRVAYELVFPDMNMVSHGEVAMRSTGQEVHVVWTTEGDLGMNPMNRWFGLFLDKMIGPDFERGLARLKAVSEGAAK